MYRFKSVFSKLREREERGLYQIVSQSRIPISPHSPSLLCFFFFLQRKHFCPAIFRSPNFDNLGCKTQFPGQKIDAARGFKRHTDTHKHTHTQRTHANIQSDLYCGQTGKVKHKLTKNENFRRRHIN